MIASICSICHKIYGLKEEQSPGLLFSHGYCAPCGDAELVKIFLYTKDSEVIESIEVKEIAQ
jgi:hypothetical protein